MNLTKCFVAGLCLTAMTASAVEKKANAFETLADLQQTGWWIAVDTSLQSDGVVVDGDASLDGYAGVRPMTGVTSNKVLKLDTEGGVWTNTINESFATTPIFADMLVKFVPSEELPTLTEGKLAIAIKLELDGTNYLNVANNNTIENSYIWAVTAKAISTSEWYRVTVKMYSDPDLLWTYAQVYVNGAAVGGPLELDGNETLNSIGFQGTGFIDEVVVRDDDPFESSTVAFGGTGPQVDPLELNAWKSANLIVGTEDPDSFNAFVMNVAPDLDGISPVLVVNSIVIDGTTTLTVMAKYANDSLVALGTPLYNGAVLTVWGKVNLEDANWVNIGTDLTDFDQTTYKFFTVTTGEAPTL